MTHPVYLSSSQDSKNGQMYALFAFLKDKNNTG